jgi:GTP-binding protein
VDLPGYGFAHVPIEVKRSWGSMVETYLRKRPNLRAVVVILDIRRDPSAGDIDLLNWLKRYGIDSILILTKADKLSRNQSLTRARLISSKLKKISGDRPVIFSTKTREGKAEIWGKIDQVIKA